MKGALWILYLLSTRNSQKVRKKKRYIPKLLLFVALNNKGQFGGGDRSNTLLEKLKMG